MTSSVTVLQGLLWEELHVSMYDQVVIKNLKGEHIRIIKKVN